MHVQHEIFQINNFKFEFIRGAFAASVREYRWDLGWMLHKVDGNRRMHVLMGKRISGDTTRDLILTVTTIPQVHIKTRKRKGRSIWRGSFIWQWVREYTISRGRNNSLDDRTPNINRRVTILFKDSWIRENICSFYPSSY